VARSGGAVLVDAADGLAFPRALAVAGDRRAREHGVPSPRHEQSSLRRRGGPPRPVAAAGMVGLAFELASAMPAWGQAGDLRHQPIAACSRAAMRRRS
jgi:hypothetical protein